MEFVNWYHGIIEQVIHQAGVSDRTIHVAVGMAIWLGVVFVLRHRSAHWIALAATIVAEVGNEVLDRIFWGTWNWPNTISDALATWIVPAVLTLALQWTRQYRHYRRPPPSFSSR